MKHITLILLLTIACLVSCQKKNKKVIVENTFHEIENAKIKDSILEKNNPKNLDLPVHQLFIDTTKNSTYYDKLANWNPNNEKNETLEFYRKTISKSKPISKIDINNFPSLWTKINKYKGEFILYNRCDGIDRRFEIKNNSIFFFGPINSHVEIINKMTKLTENEIVIELKVKRNGGEKNALFSIRKTEYNSIYLLEYDSEIGLVKELVTPIDKISEFNLVVNNCPEMKTIEFSGFDEIDYSVY